jgi:tetratricopeptide (TPR) repeat protein
MAKSKSKKLLQGFFFFIANRFFAESKQLEMRFLVQTANKFLADWNQHVWEANHTTLGGYLRGSDLFDAAQVEMEKQNWQKAIKYFKEVLSISDNHYQSYGNIGLCYAKLGMKQEALRALDQAIKINPGYELAIVNRAFINILAEGECLEEGAFQTIDYGKDYAFKNNSYLNEMVSKIYESD